MPASHQNLSTAVLERMRRQVAADSVLMAHRLQPPRSRRPGAGFSDLFAAACGETPGGEHYHASLEYIFEGYLLHFGTSRLLAPAPDNGFLLLAGDYMYARGLTSIARLDDPAPVRALAGLISLCAWVHCEQLDPAMALEAWSATTLCLATHAAADGAAPGGLKLLKDYKKEVWSGLPAATTPVAAMIAALPGETAGELREIIDTIYASFNPAISA